jgi:hypothetical protein
VPERRLMAEVVGVMDQQRRHEHPASFGTRRGPPRPSALTGEACRLPAPARPRRSARRETLSSARQFANRHAFTG